MRTTIPFRPSKRSLTVRLLAWMVAFGGVSWIHPAQGQISSIDSPQTDLTPIGPPALGGAGAFGSGPRFDPYASPSTGFGGFGNSGLTGAPVTPIPTPPVGASTFGSSPSLGLPSFGTSNGFGAAPLASPAVPGGSGYPNGSFFGRLFSRTPTAPAFGTGSLAAGPPILAPPAQQLHAPTYAPGTVYGGAPSALGVPTYAPPTSFGGGAYPSAVYPSNSPTTLFPGGLFGGAGIGGVFAQDPNFYDAYRFFQGTRLRHSYISGGDGADEVEKNQTDVSVAFAFQNFLYSGRPLYVAPSFSLHLWDGPVSVPGPGSADLPSSVYDAFLDFGWQTDPNQMFGVELGLRLGVFSDFEVMNSDSFRIRGKGLGSFRLTPASTLKAGVYYLDRNTIQLLPAGGLLWQPTPTTRYDIFFPEPKLAHYWRTIGTQDVWWYLAGEYGGGAWTIERTGGMRDNVEMNEIRAVFGLEWGRSELIRTGRRRAFVEFGYVFDREVHYERNPLDDFTPDDAFIVRGGFGY